jgi:glycosyltransferase involved in cell wall biosynthesis
MSRRLCLNMIVKNEAAIIERSLVSVAPWVDAWVICDTGSTDKTETIVDQFFSAREIPGELHRVEFHDFSQARNAALDRARASRLDYDYLLLCDADMELVVDKPEFAREIDGPAYMLLQRNRLAYYNTRLLRRDSAARYVGVTHEFLDLGSVPPQLAGAWFIDHAAGSNRANKFDRDVRLLERALATDPHNARHVFYLAQSLRDAGRLVDARREYLRRVSMGGWQEEVAYSLLQVAVIDERRGRPTEDVRRAYLSAYYARPTRIEPLVELARVARTAQKWADALLYARAAAAAHRPADTLFVDEPAYLWRALDELAIAAWFAGAHDEGRAAATRLLAESRFPEEERGRIVANARYYGLE